MDDVYRVEVRAQEDPSSVVAVGVLELARDTDLGLLQSDLDLVDPGHGRVLMRRTVERSTHRGRDVLRVLDLSHEQHAPDGEREVRRTYCGYLRDQSAGLVVRLEVATVDMLAFDDMDSVCTDVLTSVVVKEEGRL